MPQWVLDEAAGRPVGPVPFRGGASEPLTPGLPAPHRRGLRAGRLAAAVAVAGALAVAGLALRGGPAAAPGSLAQPAPAVGQGPVAQRPLQHGPVEPLGTPPVVPPRTEGVDYRFWQEQDDGRPVTWSPCRAVRYVTRPDHAPPGGSALVAEAVARISAATGLRFEDAGTTAEAPDDAREVLQPDRYGDDWAPVLIAWGTPDEVPDLGAESVLALAAPQSITTALGEQVFVSGFVHLDPEGISEVVLADGPAAGRAVVLHELGHLVGLDHVNRDTEVMAPEGMAVTELGPGDRAGLAELGRGSCPPEA